MTQPPPAGPPLPSGPAGGPPPAPPAPAGAGSRRLRRGLLVAGAATGVLVLGGTGYAIASYLSGGGAQPEEALPADTLAFVKLDLDPAAGQKVAVASLLDEFPDLVDDGEDGDLRSTLVEPLLAGNEWGLSYDRDVEPWLGDRLALAAVPDPDSAAGVAPVVVLAVTDRDAMTDRLGAVDAADFAFAVRDDFVLIGQSQQLVDRLQATEATLDGDEDYTGDRDALGGDQVAVAWADLAGLQDVVATTVAAAGGGFGAGLEDQALTGRLVLGVHAESDALEVRGLTRGAAPAAAAAGTEPTRLVGALPADTLAALSVSGLGNALADGWGAVADTLPPELADELAGLGLELPADLRAVLGSDLVVTAVGDLSAPQVGARVRTEDPQRAVQVLEQLLGQVPDVGPVTTARTADGYVLATGAALAGALAGDGGLGDTPAFRAAVADPDAGTVAFVDLGALVDQVVAAGGDGAAEAAELESLGAAGFSATTTGGDARFVLRVTTR